MNHATANAMFAGALIAGAVAGQILRQCVFPIWENRKEQPLDNEAGATPVTTESGAGSEPQTITTPEPTVSEIISAREELNKIVEELESISKEMSESLSQHTDHAIQRLERNVKALTDHLVKIIKN